MSNLPPKVAAAVFAAAPLYGYQKRLVDSTATFTLSNWSRQVGKSHATALRRVLRGLERRRNQILLSASETQSRELMLKVRMHLHAMQVYSKAIESRVFAGTSFAQMEIEVPGIMRVIGLPANPRTARGFTGDVLLDEFAMHVEDREIWAAVFPTIARGGGDLDIASTPKGKSNLFYEIFTENETFEKHTVTIHDAIADGCPHDIATLRAGCMDEETWRQEFLCEFVDEATAFITHDMISACQDATLSPPVDFVDANEDEIAGLDLGWLDDVGGDVFLGWDVGRRHDLTVVWCLERVGNRLVTRQIITTRNTRHRVQRLLLDRLMGHRKVRRCCVDKTGMGDKPAEELIEDFGAYRVEGVTFGLTTKQSLAGQLRDKVVDQLISIPVDKKVRDDWHAITKQTTPGGNIRFMAERTKDGHSDRFWAAALAVEAAGTPSGPAEAMSAGRFPFARKGGAL